MRGKRWPNKKAHTGVKMRIAKAASKPEKPSSAVELARKNIRKIKLIGYKSIDVRYLPKSLGMFNQQIDTKPPFWFGKLE